MVKDHPSTATRCGCNGVTHLFICLHTHGYRLSTLAVRVSSHYALGLPSNSAEPTPEDSEDSKDSSDPQLDTHLIKGCRAGDALAWEQLVSKYQRLVLSVPLSFGFDSAESEDIAQITFTILMQSLDSLRDVDHLSSWLYTVAQRHTWRALKRN